MIEQFHRAQHLLHQVNETHGLRFTLQSRCHDGVVGAWLITDPAGRRAVLKANDGMAHRITRMPGIVDRIRAARYPTPAWLVAGVTATGRAYHIVDFVPGEPISHGPLTAQIAAQLVTVIEAQVGLDPDRRQDWSRGVSAMAFDEEAASPRTGLRQMGRPGVELIEHFDTMLAPYKGIELPAGDLVHGDFNTSNVLARNGEISGIVDMDACGSGTRAVDYGWLLREAYIRNADPDAIATIRQAGEAVAGPGVLAICAAATAFDGTDFRRAHQPDIVPDLLPGLHRLADALQSA